MEPAILRVLMYHRVVDPRSTAGDNPSVISATPAEFERQMQHLARNYNVVSVQQVLDAVRNERQLPTRAVLLTFDDGYRDFGEIAWPILRHFGFPAVLFVATAYPDRPDRAFWWDRLARAIHFARQSTLDDTPLGKLSLLSRADRAASLKRVRARVKVLPHWEGMQLVDTICSDLDEAGPPTGQVLTWQELRKLMNEGLCIGAHTRSHPALTRLSPAEAREEIRGSREDLLRELGESAPIFSYPFGDYDTNVVELVQDAGFELAVTCRPGINRLTGDDALVLRRSNISRRTSLWVFRIRLTRCGAYLDELRLSEHTAPRRPVPPATSVAAQIG